MPAETSRGSRRCAGSGTGSELTAEPLLERALAFAPTGLAVVGLDGRIRWANRELANMIGAAESELVGRDVDDLVYPNDELVVPREVAPTGRTFDRSRRRVRRADGTLVWVRM